jgi:hypothetical protein
MKTILFLFLTLLASGAFGQKKTSIANCSMKLSYLQNDSVYIKGKHGKMAISRKFFRKKFKLAVSDNDYKIVGFYMSWNDKKARIYQRGNKGAIVSPDINAAKAEKESYSLKNLEPGVVLVFDCIILRKGNSYYKAKPLVCDIAL